MIIEKKAERLITYESQPDGGKTPIIDPYDGCSINCPYCFQSDDPDWNRAIYVKTGIDDLIGPELGHWPKNETIYLGSRCDPYMTIEAKYRLTRKCLFGLSELGISTMITTKGNIDLISRDIDIYKEFGTSLTILLGFSRLSDYLDQKAEYKKRLQLAIGLNSNNIRVWAFVTPLLPGITSVEHIKTELPEEIPIFIDYLRIGDNAPRRKRIENYIHEHFPKFVNSYGQILNNDAHKYYDDLLDKYGTDQRFKFLFRNIQESVIPKKEME